MAGVWTRLSAALAAGLALLVGVAAAGAQEAAGLHEQPVLLIDPGMHTIRINRADVDAAGQFVVTGSDDKTVRVWRLGPTLELETTIRLPSGPGEVGKVYAVAIGPNGALIAAGGWTSPPDRQEQIYLFSRDGKLVKRIDDLPDVVAHLAFSRGGRYLAAGLGNNGIRIYDLDKGWGEVARDTDYGGTVYGLDFAGDGRLATTSLDGHVRLYDADFRRVARQATTAGREPYGIAFHPDGRRLAVGFSDARVVALLDGHSLEPLDPPNGTGIYNGNLAGVSWSRDGSILLAAGTFDHVDGQNYIVTWAGVGGSGQRRFLVSGATNTITSLKALPDGSLMVAAADPHLALLASDGSQRAARSAPHFEPRGQERNLAVSADGTVVEFGYEQGGQERVRFDVAGLKLIASPPDDDRTALPRQSGLDIQDWLNRDNPTLAGTLLPLDRHEISRSLAIHPKGDRFVLGTEWRLRAYEASGQELWYRSVPGVVRAVNITGDGRLVVAAHSDGTIRWHRMDDGRELLALFPLIDRTNWVAWTPEGFYAATPGAHGVLRWHVNRGWDQPAETYPVSEFRYLRRPEALALVLQEMETARALGLDDMRRAAREVQQRTRSKLAPGARLHVVSVGVSRYAENAKHLRLDYAHKDAQDVISALINTQSGLYAQVLPQQITDQDATRTQVLDAVKAMRSNMASRSGGGDVAVFHFSGHGALINGRYFLLGHDVDARDSDRITSTAISIVDLRDALSEIGKHGRVLVLLDACRSGAASADGTALSVDGGQLRSALAGLANVTVLTSSESAKPSHESKEWENGAFTKVFLHGLAKEADRDGNGLISMSELQSYMSQNLPRLTQGKGDQVLGMELRFDSEIFVSGL